MPERSGPHAGVLRASGYCHLLPGTDMRVTVANGGIRRLKPRPVFPVQVHAVGQGFIHCGFKDTSGKVSELYVNFVLENLPLTPPQTPVL